MPPPPPDPGAAIADGRVRVVDARTGEVPGCGKAIGRTLFAGFISGNSCDLGDRWMLRDGRNQTWHDEVASTLVTRVVVES